ncbi:hypothetical protein I79_005125 [Cricetulus griseus]|uniref:Uncharacterized protein n=1 Tax=Cricetulus griseus TaxID=10029 RepID=G3H4C4_CRIGR|nr:hypothetical protein I79_005125 [Cricetulus griseus]
MPGLAGPQTQQAILCVRACVCTRAEAGLPGTRAVGLGCAFPPCAFPRLQRLLPRS